MYKVIYLVLLGCVLSGCGGGGDSAPQANPFGETASFADLCAAPRTGVDPITKEPYGDQQGSLTTEKQWLRAWTYDEYLWRDDIPNTLTAFSLGYPTTEIFFDALKTQAKWPNGSDKDRFHFSAKTSEDDQYSSDGSAVSYGLHFTRNQLQSGLFVSRVDVGSSGAHQGVVRGDRILSIDGFSADDTSPTYETEFIPRLFPSQQGVSFQFELESITGEAKSVRLTANTTITDPVPLYDVYTNEDESVKVGYLVFHAHLAETAEPKLIEAIELFKTYHVNQLILDLRYNTGGYLDIASRLAYMIAGPVRTNNKVFERIEGNATFNQKYSLSSRQLEFLSRSSEKMVLPSLGLSSVTVLSTEETCSASESIINSLRGIGVRVNIVGNATCGKPYGFIPGKNCGTSYYSIQFKGYNHLGQSDYDFGFTPTCESYDNLAFSLGDSHEWMLEDAFNFILDGQCYDYSNLLAAEAVASSGAVAPRKSSQWREAEQRSSAAHQGLKIVDIAHFK